MTKRELVDTLAATLQLPKHQTATVGRAVLAVHHGRVAAGGQSRMSF
jgi:hypothetical protein